jgi:hypothetical protein
MIENSHNKMQTGAPREKDLELEYHFAGSGTYYPLTVKASSPEEAHKKWEDERVAYDQEVKKEKKSEDLKEEGEIIT